MSSTRERLVRCAVELFGRHGFHAVGLDRVIDEAGVSKQTFYNHFESKDDLVLAALGARHTIDARALAELLDRLAGPSPRARLYALFDAVEARFALPDWRGCLFMNAAFQFPNPHEPVHRAAREHFAEFQSHLTELAAQAEAADPAGVAARLTLLVEGALICRHIGGGDARATELARAMAQAVLDEAFAATATPA